MFISCQIKNRTTFYIGVTNTIVRRVYEHRLELCSGFTSKYNVTDLMYYEEKDGILEGIAREKQLKNWHRDWKINLIKENNPTMKDLSAEWFDLVNNQLEIKESMT